MNEYEEFKNKILMLQSDWNRFTIDFINSKDFKEFADDLIDKLRGGAYNEVRITGYFSETVRESLEQFAQMAGHKVQLITQELDLNKPKEKKNLDVLRSLCKKGVEIKVNNRIHARLLVARQTGFPQTLGLLIIGSFDFNTEGMGKERLDAGIRTKHPDLVNAAIEFFDIIWNASESIPLNEKYQF